ncbi:MAG TPA: hypothetical protein VMT61_09860 [Candidatus Binataceae bacterium]|nr:hypothetical protein [Candidatus Binataceae bacterium]
MNRRRLDGGTGECAASRNSSWLAVALGGVIALAGFGGHAFAQDAGDAAKGKATACVDPIISCGCTITKKGVYHVTKDLNSTQPLTPAGNCLEVKASNVVLDLEAHAITGPGVAAANNNTGIYINAGSPYLTLTGGSPTGGTSLISGWSVGVGSDSNLGTISDIETDLNDVGIELLHSTSNNVTFWGAYDNIDVGLWVRQGQKNYIAYGDAGNSISPATQKVGILVGCGATATAAGVNCSGKSAGKSVQNNIQYAYVNDNTFYGIALDTNATGNVVISIQGVSNITDDLFDSNAACDSNDWLNNIAGDSTATPPIVGKNSPACTLND